MKEKGINLIVLEPRLYNYNRFRNDPEWEDFLHNYTKYNFTKKYIPEAEVELLISNNLFD